MFTKSVFAYKRTPRVIAYHIFPNIFIISIYRAKCIAGPSLHEVFKGAHVSITENQK